MCLAVPGKIVEITDADAIGRMGKVQFGQVFKDVSLTFTPEAGVGDYVIVHVGVAISQLDEEEAERVFSYLDQMGELEELEPDQAQGTSS